VKKVSDKLADNVKQHVTNEEYQDIKDKIIEEATKNEKDSKIKPLSNLKGKPIFIFGGQYDPEVPLWNQLLTAEFFH
jgi:hypothetical protein